MQPVKLRLEGEFWDTQIYMGFLYLFARDGSLVVIDWDRLVGDLGERTGQAFATEAALRRSDHLYGPSARLFLTDPGIRSVVVGRFETLAASDLFLDRATVARYVVQHAESPSPFPHADSVLYNSLLYTVGKSGVYCAPCATKRRGTAIGRGIKRWDGSASACAASYNTVALATGASGLFEMISGSSYEGEVQVPHLEPRLIVDRHCTDCSWSFFNIFGTSRFHGSFLVQYKLRQDQDYPDEGQMMADAGWAEELASGLRQTSRRREFDRIVDEQELFGVSRSGYEIAYQDKIYRVHDKLISVIKANPYSKKADGCLNSFGEVQIAGWKGNLVSAKVAVFGVVLEYDAAIVVIGNGADESLETHTIQGEPVSWRVFPRSANYRNHLHIVRDDCLEVLSFNHDYFVEQKVKRMGTRYSAVSGRRFV